MVLASGRLLEMPSLTSDLPDALSAASRNSNGQLAGRNGTGKSACRRSRPSQAEIRRDGQEDR
jgi:hypothetical protein